MSNELMIQTIIKKFEYFRYKHGLLEVFHDALAMWTFALSNKFDFRAAAEREKHYLEIAKKYNKDVTLVADSEEQSEINEAARKCSKGEIFDCISQVAFLAGALWAKVKQAGSYKPAKEQVCCPLCGKNYE